MGVMVGRYRWGVGRRLPRVWCMCVVASCRRVYAIHAKITATVVSIFLFAYRATPVLVIRDMMTKINLRLMLARTVSKERLMEANSRAFRE
jgi:hypothetical protein